MFSKFWNEETGAVVSIELVLIITVAVISLIVGLSEVAVSVNTELNDISNAIGHLNQTYAYSGFAATSHYKTKSYVGGAAYNDGVDDCDNNQSCDIVCGTRGVRGEDSYW